MLLTFFLAVFGWIIFRAESIGQAWEFFKGMLQSGTLRASYRFFTWSEMWPSNLFIILMLVVEWLEKDKEFALQNIHKTKLFSNRFVRLILYALFLFVTFAFRGGSVEFIYFQF